MELLPGKRVVQAWRATTWEPGLYSVVRFELHLEDAHTELIFDHSAFPEEERSDLEAGWHEMYFEPMRTHLASH